MDGIEVRMTDAGIDWAALRDDLGLDEFDNGRSPAQLQASFANSYAVAFAWDGDRCVGTARVLSDGVCNAYLVDVWTLSSHRRRGIATALTNALLDRVRGQHVALFTEHESEVYRKLGFEQEHVGMSRVVGEWLKG